MRFLCVTTLLRSNIFFLFFYMFLTIFLLASLAGCLAPKKKGTVVSSRLLQRMKKKNMDPSSPVMIRIFKKEARLEVWKQKREGYYGLLAHYPVCKYSGMLGPKKKEGDRQAPEGFYEVTAQQMNPNSRYHLSFNIGFPNPYDEAHGYTGSYLMVHGGCSSAGCYAMTDPFVEEIYSLVRQSLFAGHKSITLQAFPFRMTEANMMKYQNNPHYAFWTNLKEGYDAFENTRIPPYFGVCRKRYVFYPLTKNLLADFLRGAVRFSYNPVGCD